MEKFLTTLPKPVLIFFVLVIGVVVSFIVNPPHTVCDTNIEILRESLTGMVTPRKDKKRTFPPKILEAKELCEQGYSTGSCYDYFGILKQVAKQALAAPRECTVALYEMPEVKKTIDEGVEKMALMAWGSQLPQPGLARLGWFQESEVMLFCKMSEVMLRALGEEAWTEYRKKILAKFPGPLPPPPAFPKPKEGVPVEDGQGLAQEEPLTPEPAIMTLPESEVWALSLFSISCENY